MLRSRAIKKIFMTTLGLFIVICLFSISNINNNDVLRTNLEIEEITGLGNCNIYLLNDNGYLVANKIILDSEKIEDNVLKVLDNLIISKSTKFSNHLKGIIPEGTKVNNVIFANNIITIDFSKELLNIDVSHEKSMIQAIVYSIMDINGVEGVSILINEESLLEYPNTHEKLDMVLDKSIGINNQYDIKSRDNISKVVIYYLTNLDNYNYYVPVTKYSNDSREKIEVIIDELSNNDINNNLVSLLNSNIKLINYEEKDGTMILNFNERLYDHKNIVLEEVFNSISYSVFDNYDVDMVMFQIDSKPIKEVAKRRIK